MRRGRAGGSPGGAERLARKSAEGCRRNGRDGGSRSAGGRHRDLGDITDILFMQGRLDEQYMRHWAKELGVAEKLEQLLKESREM